MRALTMRLLNQILAAIPYSWRGQIKRIPVISRIQQRVASSVFDNEEFIHECDAGPARGVRFLVKLPEDKGIWTGTY